VYADTKNDPSVIDSSYATLARRPAFRQLCRQVPFTVTWDDHDYGAENTDKRYALKEENKRIFRQFWDLTGEIPADRSGVYHARIMDVGDKQLQIVMLDVRYNRDEPGPESGILGAGQWQ